MKHDISVQSDKIIPVNTSLVRPGLYQHVGMMNHPDEDGPLYIVYESRSKIPNKVWVDGGFDIQGCELIEDRPLELQMPNLELMASVAYIFNPGRLNEVVILGNGIGSLHGFIKALGFHDTEVLGVEHSHAVELARQALERPIEQDVTIGDGYTALRYRLTPNDMIFVDMFNGTVNKKQIDLDPRIASMQFANDLVKSMARSESYIVFNLNGYDRPAQRRMFYLLLENLVVVWGLDLTMLNMDDLEDSNPIAIVSNREFNVRRWKYNLKQMARPALARTVNSVKIDRIGRDSIQKLRDILGD